MVAHESARCKRPLLFAARRRHFKWRGSEFSGGRPAISKPASPRTFPRNRTYGSVPQDEFQLAEATLLVLTFTDVPLQLEPMSLQ
jgi:hypothetical protein